jgi:hypothetical protein
MNCTSYDNKKKKRTKMHTETTFKFNVVHKRNISNKLWNMIRRKKRDKETSNKTETSIMTLLLSLKRSCWNEYNDIKNVINDD